MNTRREFLTGLGAGLILTIGGITPAVSDGVSTSPSDMVRDFLAARARHDPAGQYALFSDKDRNEIPFTQFDTQFTDKALLSRAFEDGVSPLLTSVTLFFMDAHGAFGYRFSVAGPDPNDPQVVLVHAQPPGVAPEKAFILKISTARDPLSGAPRLEMMPSYQKTNLHDFEAMREHARGLGSLSNLRQIGLALITYAQAHDDRLPDADGWVDALLPIWAASDKSFPAENLFRDPSAPEGQRWNYAFNRALSSVRLGDIKDPAATVMVFESTTGLKNAADTGQSLPRPGRHGGGDYYAFADGRAKWLADGVKPSFLLNGK